jgi:hypothetical protein
MRLRCADGELRRFRVCRPAEHSVFSAYTEAQCEECGHLFGVHDTTVLRPMFKAHVCAKRQGQPHVSET